MEQTKMYNIVAKKVGDGNVIYVDSVEQLSEARKRVVEYQVAFGRNWMFHIIAAS